MENGVLAIIIIVLIIGSAGVGMYLHFKRKRKATIKVSSETYSNGTATEYAYMPFIRTMATVFKHKDVETQKNFLEMNKYKISEYEMKYGFGFKNEYNAVLDLYSKI